MQSRYLIFIFFLLIANVKFRASVKIPLIKRSKQKDKLNHRLVLTTEILLSTSTSIYVICKGIYPSLQMQKRKKLLSFKQMYAKVKLNLRLELRFHNDFTKKIVQFAEQTNVKKNLLVLVSFKTELRSCSEFH